jgi:NADPH:quinone reductase-like Zn-dependent oxidoreductase
MPDPNPAIAPGAIICHDDYTGCIHRQVHLTEGILMPTNTAAWLNQKHGRFQIGESPYPSPSADQIVIRNRAVAMNPLEWIIQVEGNLTYGWLDYPTVLGSDTAGEVVEVGSGVTRFQPGDRVLGHAVGTDKDTKSAAQGTFQEYTLVLERLAAPLPDALSFEQAATLPLAVSTASCALFESAWLGLQLPCANPTPTGQTVLIWGGSTSVGSQAIQLATAAGYEVITTASPRNFESLTNLGAALVFDYNSPTVEQDIVAAMSSRTLAGAVSFGTTGAPACVRIAGASQGNRFVAIGTPPVSFEPLAEGGFGTRVLVTSKLIASNIALQVSARTKGVKLKYIFGTALKNTDVSLAIYRDFLPTALADGSYQIAPRPHVVGHGLGAIQDALDIQRRGVSAQKIVVTLGAR